MKRSVLLLILVLFGSYLTVSAQEDTIRSLVISEIRMDLSFNAYVEITNMGDSALDLGQFTFTGVSNWNNWWQAPDDREWRYPAGVMLEPGDSWTIGQLFDFRKEMTEKYPSFFYPFHKEELEAIVDQGVHRVEPGWANGFPLVNDSAAARGSQCLYVWQGGLGAFYLQWKNTEGTDSAAVDQVNLVLDGPFEDPTSNPITPHRDVAGVTLATSTHTLVRKFSVTEGNMDWFNAAGNDLAESEWMPIPNLSTAAQEYDRALFWTVDNHGDYNLDENTLTSTNPDVVVDYAAKTISVPWGFRNNDSVMYEMERKPGVAWHYSFSPEREDSAHNSVRLGDTLTIYVCGSDLDVAHFAMIPRDPEAGANIVVPKNGIDWESPYNEYIVQRGKLFEVTTELAMDTIYDVPFGTRQDTILFYMEKPPAASWEFVLLNDEERADVKTGDLLRVTAENGNVKDYYIKTDIYQASSNALLASIRWPDIDEFTYDAFGWVGDTIPNFSSGSDLFTVKVPYYTEGIPHLVAKPVNVNTTIEVTRPAGLSGSPEARTMTFHCTAEDDSTTFTYKVIFEKEKDPTDLQPFEADPFQSQYSNEAQYENWDNALEIMNPGSGQIDMSHYMMASAASGTSPADVITSFTDWADRFRKYIPGMKFVDSTDWAVTPGLFTEDLTVNSIVYGGDVFVAASGGDRVPDEDGMYHWNEAQFDVNFRDTTNYPWTDPRSSNFDNPRDGSAVDLWGGNYYLFRIDNDSVYEGLKPATDPQDFTLIDLFGFMDGSDKYDYMNRNNITLVDEPHLKSHKAVHFRKPYVFEGKPEGFSEAAKLTNDSSEWYALFSDDHLVKPPYDTWGWGEAQRQVMGWLGSHTMDEVTAHMSFVESNTYLVDEGYQGDDLEIVGVVTGTTVEDLITGILKKDEGQTLTVKDAGGTVITGSTPVPDGGMLEVVSANGENMTSYTLVVTADGLSDDAVLTSTVYEITVAGSVGFITEFPFGTSLRDVVDNVVVPDGASMVVVDDKDFFVPFQQLNYDTVQVPVTATDKIYFEVTAQDQQTMIKYQLLPVTGEGDLFVVSDVYEVDQELSVIRLVPEATNRDVLLSNLTPSAGATLSLLDKFGFERTFGPIYRDDILRVTALDGVTTREYNLVMLGLEEFANYLANVTSDVYTVDQVSMTISEVPGDVDVTTLMSNLVPSTDATMEVLDDQGVARAGSDIVQLGDQVKVTAANGVTVAYYTVETITGIGEGSGLRLSVYPNPTSGVFRLEGLQPGDHIRIFNAVGEAVLSRVASSASEELSLKDASAGIYVIMVDDGTDSLRKLKLIKSN